MDVENANCKMRISQCGNMEVSAVEQPIKVDREITGLDHLIQELHAVFSNDHVNVQDVQKLMAAYKSNPNEWKKYAKFDRFRYTRNLVDAGNGAFNIMILCWGAGHASPIHDHADSHCFMKLLSGNLDEVRYNWPQNVESEVMKVMKSNKARRRSQTDIKETSETPQDDSRQCDSCQDDGCKDYRAKADKDEQGQEEEMEYNAEDMEEIGRTRLELNDVCYINDALGLHRMENPSHVDGAVSLHLYCPPFDSCRVFDSRTGKPTEVKVTFWSVYGKKIKRRPSSQDDSSCDLTLSDTEEESSCDDGRCKGLETSDH